MRQNARFLRSVASILFGVVALGTGLFVSVVIVYQWGILALVWPSGDEIEYPVLGLTLTVGGIAALVYGIKSFRHQQALRGDDKDDLSAD